jgi:hypothetical protein
MRTPTITKRQAIEAMIEQARRDYRTACAEHEAKVDASEQHLQMLVRDLVNDPVRLAALTHVPPVDPDDDDDDDEDKLDQVLANVELRQAGRYRNKEQLNLVIQINDPEILAANEQLWELRRSYPTQVNEAKMSDELDAKLTGCDPQSLLSVPENVAAIRALLNGLVLLPQH